MIKNKSCRKRKNIEFLDKYHKAFFFQKKKKYDEYKGFIVL